jgi:energy-coupling factor transport system ATP-binding protein
MSITLEKVGYVYSPGTPFEHEALKNISITFNEGTITGIMGTTGAGKSTLLQLLNGLLLPTGGRVLIEGEDTARLKRRDLVNLRQKVGLVFQFPEKQLFEATVGEDIAFGPRQLKLPEDEIRDRVEWAMAAAGIDPNLSHRAPTSLSSGQKRMVAIAGVLAMQPILLALDEPSAGLDFKAQSRLFQILQKINKQNQTTMVLVSHSLPELVQFCSHLILMAHGKIIISGTAADVLSHRELLLEHGFELPLWSETIRQLNQKGWDITTPAYNTESAAKAIAKSLREFNAD